MLPLSCFSGGQEVRVSHDLQQPAKVGLLDSASSQGAQDPGSLCLGPPTARVPLKPHGPHACLQLVLSHLGTGMVVCKETQAAGPWALGQGSLVASQARS